MKCIANLNPISVMTESLLASSSEALFLAPLVTFRDDTIGQKKKKKIVLSRERRCVYTVLFHILLTFLNSRPFLNSDLITQQ